MGDVITAYSVAVSIGLQTLVAANLNLFPEGASNSTGRQIDRQVDRKTGGTECTK